MARWRSRAVTLVLLGAGAAACAPEPQYRRNTYASREECLRDYSPGQCEPHGTRGFIGPFFWVGGGARPLVDPGPGASARDGRSSVAAGVTAPAPQSAVRGGMGATGRNGGYSGGA